MYSSLRVLLDDVQPLHFHLPNRPWQTRPVNFLRAKHAAHSSSVIFSLRHLFLHQHIQLVVTWVFSTESGMTVLWHGLPGGLPTSLLAGRFPVDVSADQKAAFPRTQTLSAPEPARFHQSDTKSPCLLCRNTHPDSSPDTAGDTPPHRKYPGELRSYLFIDTHSIDAGCTPSIDFTEGLSLALNRAIGILRCGLGQADWHGLAEIHRWLGSSKRHGAER